MQRRRIVPLEHADYELWQKGGGVSSKGIDSRLLRLVISERLTQIQQEYLSDYYFGGMNMREIARAHGVALSTVSRTIKRARCRIKDALKYSVRS